jgi:hypothetical protein
MQVAEHINGRASAGTIELATKVIGNHDISLNSFAPATRGTCPGTLWSYVRSGDSLTRGTCVDSLYFRPIAPEPGLSAG